MLSCAIVGKSLEIIQLLEKYIQETPRLYVKEILTDLTLSSCLEVNILLIDDEIFLRCHPRAWFGNNTILLAEDNSKNEGIFSLNKSHLSYSSFLNAIEKVAGKLYPYCFSAYYNFLFIPVGSHGKMKKIYFADIYYIEAFSNYCAIHCIDTSYLIHSSMKIILNRLPKDNFLRIHRSFIVNTMHIREFEGNRVFLENSTEITIGRAYKEEFYKFISNFSLK